MAFEDELHFDQTQPETRPKSFEEKYRAGLLGERTRTTEAGGFIPCHLPNLASQARTSVDRAGCQAPPQESYYQHLLTLMEVV